MGTCPSHQPWLCSTLHRGGKQLRRRGWLACFLSPGDQEGPDAGSEVPLKKAALSAVLSPSLQPRWPSTADSHGFQSLPGPSCFLLCF